jgi:hypothetical protein
MKKILIALTIGAALGTAQAGIFFTDSFSYPDGSLVTNSGGLWATHSGTAGQMQVTGGQAIVSGANSEDVHRDTGTTMGAGDIWYAGFDVTVSGTETAPVYFAHFITGASTFGSRVFITSPASGGDFAFALSGTSSVDQTWASDSTFGVTYRLVASYNYDTGAAQLWLNPSSESDTSLTSVNGFANDAFTGFAFREASNGSTESIDNITIANTFSEALTGVAVPEPSTLAMAASGGLALLGLGFKRRK